MKTTSYASRGAKKDLSDPLLAGSNQEWRLSDLHEFGGALSERGEWLEDLLHSRSNATFPRVAAVNCSQIWTNDEKELAAAREFQKSYVRQPEEDVRHYLEETVNCTSSYNFV